MRLRTLAPAKLNLYLQVTGRRPDGFHTLDSLFVFAGVGDVITMEAADALTFHVTGPRAHAVPAADNLVMETLQVIAACLGKGQGKDLGFAVTLHKELPVAAGLGGGSSDAAATVRMLGAFWPEVYDLPLTEILTPVGADIPACMAAHPVLVTGIGEELTPAGPIPPLWTVIVNSGTPVATAAVFKALRVQDLSMQATPRSFQSDPGQSDPGQSDPGQSDPDRTMSDFLNALRLRDNHLAGPALQLDPDIARTIAAVAQTPGCLLSRMSGSGGSVFGLYASHQHAEAAARQVTEAFPTYWVEAAPVLSAPPPLERM